MRRVAARRRLGVARVGRNRHAGRQPGYPPVYLGHGFGRLDKLLLLLHPRPAHQRGAKRRFHRPYLRFLKSPNRLPLNAECRMQNEVAIDFMFWNSSDKQNIMQPATTYGISDTRNTVKLKPYPALADTIAVVLP